jgi:hypothetical protein
MSQKVANPEGKKENTILKAFTDLVILALLLTGAGFGGYFWGVHQQLAPVLKVGVGWPGALPPPISPKDVGKKEGGQTAATGNAGSTAAAAPADAAKTAGTGSKTSGAASSESASKSEESSAGETAKEAARGSKKYWITSSGIDYIGYAITVKVNGTPVDSFFGPGKTIDVSRLVKAGDNTLEFDAKEMGDQYNKHTGDASSKLILQLVSGAHVSDTFKKSDVLASFQRTAADTEDSDDTQHFSGN